jgi:hypothetical protein
MQKVCKLHSSVFSHTSLVSEIWAFVLCLSHKAGRWFHYFILLFAEESKLTFKDMSGHHPTFWQEDIILEFDVTWDTV